MVETTAAETVEGSADAGAKAWWAKSSSEDEAREGHRPSQAIGRDMPAGFGLAGGAGTLAA